MVSAWKASKASAADRVSDRQWGDTYLTIPALSGYGLQLLYRIDEPFLSGKGGDACKEMLIVNTWESESFNI